MPTDDDIKISELIEKAGDGDVQAQYQLGVIYYEDDSIEQHYSLAFECFEKAALQGIVLAQSYLGAMYYSGRGVEQDTAKAKEWLNKAYDSSLEASDWYKVLITRRIAENPESCELE